MTTTDWVRNFLAFCDTFSDGSGEKERDLLFNTIMSQRQESFKPYSTYRDCLWALQKFRNGKHWHPDQKRTVYGVMLAGNGVKVGTTHHSDVLPRFSCDDSHDIENVVFSVEFDRPQDAMLSEFYLKLLLGEVGTELPAAEQKLVANKTSSEVHKDEALDVLTVFVAMLEEAVKAAPAKRRRRRA